MGFAIVDRGANADLAGELARRVELLQGIIDKVPGMIAYWDSEQRCRFANAAFLRWFGVTPEGVIGRTMEELLGPMYEMNLPYIHAVLQGESQLFEREIPDPSGGPPRFSQAQYEPDVVGGVIRGFIAQISDVTARHELERDVREAHALAEAMATHDALTGLPNRVLFEDRLQRAIELSRRQQHSSAVLFLDLDGFKNINDTVGHAKGDAVLREVARRLLGALRKSDTIARLGGDEFLVLIPDLTDRDQAATVAQKMLSTMCTEPFEDAGHLPLTFSIGIAIFPENGTEMREILASADAALYRAKASGKNRFSYFTIEPMG